MFTHTHKNPLETIDRANVYTIVWPFSSLRSWEIWRLEVMDTLIPHLVAIFNSKKINFFYRCFTISNIIFDFFTCRWDPLFSLTVKKLITIITIERKFNGHKLNEQKTRFLRFVLIILHWNFQGKTRWTWQGRMDNKYCCFPITLHCLKS